MLTMIINCIFVTEITLHAKKNNNQCIKKDEQQVFIAKNGDTGIYQSNRKKAFIGDTNYIKVKSVLIDGQKKLRTPSKSIYLGKLIEGENIYELYGREENPAPVNDSPDADVRTENKIDEDFMRNFGSGKYTPDDKWD